MSPDASLSSKPMVWKRAPEVEFFERATGPLVDILLKQTGLIPQPSEEVYVLDNACGGGVVSSHILKGISSEEDKRVKIMCGDDLAIPDNTFTHVVTSFGFQIFKDAPKALRESHRVLKPGGKAAMLTWTHMGWMDPVQAAVSWEIPPLFSGHWATPSTIQNSYIEAGFVDVRVEAAESGALVESAEVLLEYTNFLKELEGEGGERFVRLLKEKYGDGEFVLGGWRALVTTGTKA